MSADEPIQINEEELATFPEAAVKLILALVARIEKLEAQVRQNSKNSSLPPSTDRFQSKPSPQQRIDGKKRKRGGQKGHKKNIRPRLPTNDVRNIIPSICGHCREKLRGTDPQPAVHQWLELPEIQPEVVEFLLHSLICSKCGKKTRGKVPVENRESYGPRLQAFVAQAPGQYRLSKRNSALLLSEIFKIPMGIGTICNIQAKMAERLEPAIGEVDEVVGNSNLPLNIDETGFRQEAQKGMAWFAGNQEVSRFRIERYRNRECMHRLIGKFDGILTSDRYSVYRCWPTQKWQICWAHLLRDFLAVKEDRNTWSWLGNKLIEEGLMMLKLWKRVRKGTLTRKTFEKTHLPEIQVKFGELLNQGAKSHPMRAGVLAKDLLANWDALWTFAKHDGVEPTNNEAERKLRALVLYRKVSLGTHSKKGSLYVERIFSVLDTCKKQGMRALDFLTETVRAAVSGFTPPSIISPH